MIEKRCRNAWRNPESNQAAPPCSSPPKKPPSNGGSRVLCRGLVGIFGIYENATASCHQLFSAVTPSQVVSSALADQELPPEERTTRRLECGADRPMNTLQNCATRIENTSELVPSNMGSVSREGQSAALCIWSDQRLAGDQVWNDQLSLAFGTIGSAHKRERPGVSTLRNNQNPQDDQGSSTLWSDQISLASGATTSFRTTGILRYDRSLFITAGPIPSSKRLKPTHIHLDRSDGQHFAPRSFIVFVKNCGLRNISGSICFN